MSHENIKAAFADAVSHVVSNSKIILEERDKDVLIVLACHSREDLESLSDVVYRVEAGRFSLYREKCGGSGKCGGL